MSQENTGSQSVSVSVPIGVIATGLLLGLAGAAYALAGRSETGSASEAAASLGKSGKGMLRKAGLMTLITLIENDATRKVVVAALRAMARRS